VDQALQETDLQDESIRDLASTLREMLGTANAIPDLPAVQNTTNVIEEISRQSLQVASLIHEYTKSPWAGNLIPLLPHPVKFIVLFIVRTIKIQGDLKSRIEGCKASCDALMAKLSRRINVDTNIRVKKIDDGLNRTGTFVIYTPSTMSFI
jgi:hypothetical protein